ncbi:MAG TPA: exodeoxyribonuclease V subunit beta [Castellaniella sp.]|uniref:exodeoxyribonuclease V subunit beta n=1 Tax=Castellaniella sp. TaxID=1955812 RepID=UPI002F070A72
MVDTKVPTMQALQFKLRGSHLIEASAGTGKTWTIAALYVRLVLGHGGQPARLPGQILVLTFTTAATLELRDRIRARLSQAAAVFAGTELPESDTFLSGLQADYPPAQWPSLSRLLELAAQSMDEAAIFTIHGWCQRVLREHAFDSGSLFELNLQPDLNEQIRLVVWDYWRAQVASLHADALNSVLGVWSGPEKLLAYQSLLTRDGLPDASQEPLAQVCAQVQSERAQRLQVLKQPWVKGADELGQWVESIREHLTGYNSANFGRWIGALRTWAQDPAQESLDLKTGWQRLTPGGIAAKWKGDDPVPHHPLSQVLADLQQALTELPGFRPAVTQHALGWIAARLQQLLASSALMGYDGLLVGLARALQGNRGQSLVQTLRTQYPVALIDEFQDTDPLQYQIFDSVYGVARNDPESAVVLIGDPKQAIYSFRGADVHTYLRAARDCADRVQTLSCNYRSSTAMVGAVNAVFRAAGDDAFVTGVEGERIAFQRAEAQGRPERWLCDGKPGAAMTACWLSSGADGKPITAGPYRERAAAFCAGQIAGLLSPGGQSGFDPGKGGLIRPVQPADVAVLVSTHADAAIIRSALSRVGVRSVYLSERESVYESPVAQDLGVCLQACAHPDDERAVRAALATPLLALSLSELHGLAEDESAWDGQVERFQGYHRCWQDRGVLPALRRLLHDFNIPANLLASGTEGERRLTDCLHLAELLQQASLHLDGEQALLRFLQQQQESSTDEDVRHLRLESDEDLVRVVTIHKSKGLEYPLVFLPFVCAGGSAPKRVEPVRLMQGGQTAWVVEPNKEESVQIAAERLGEEVRKLYVALTRARHAVWLVLADVAKVENTGMGHVLGSDLHAAWQCLVQGAAGDIVWSTEALFADPPAVQVPEVQALGPARQLAGPVVAQPWWIASYSALHHLDEIRAEGQAVRPAPQSAAEDVLREARTQALSLDESVADSEGAELASALSGFPRGSEAGTFLHGLLEWAGQRAFQNLDNARDLIARRCQVRGWEAHIDVLHQWLLDFSAALWQADLPDHPEWRFNALQSSQPELEFWLPVTQVDVARLDRLMTDHLFVGCPRPVLAPARLNGVFKGFIDLALKVGGRYYLVDYKSNDLGARAVDYAPDSLIRAMCGARYDVQLMMYLLALHRQLRARLPDYDYERDMGGALYLFLRGQNTPGQGVCAMRPSQELMDSLDALFEECGGSAHA